MSAEVRPQRGRVLVIGAQDANGSLLAQLAMHGYHCVAAQSPDAIAQVADTLIPEAILLAANGKGAAAALAFVRQHETLRALPVLADLSNARSVSAQKLGVEDWAHTPEELVQRLEAALRARRLIERDERSRLRMEMLLEITQAATSSLELSEILRIAVDKIGRVITAERLSVVLVEGSNTRTASVVATREDPSLFPLALDLQRYPEVRRALETRQTVLVEDAQRDALMGEVRERIDSLGVRSILVQPLICHDDLVGALFLRLSRGDASFGREEQEFVRTVAASLANSIRNARLHTALKKRHEDLESAYVDRYRELTEANRRLKDLNRLKDEIIAICSHDMRAPLQILLGHGRLLLDGDLEPQQQASAEAMVRQGRKILDLVESLLEKGKGEAARLSIEPRLLDIAELCKESSDELEILASQRGISLRSECPESLITIGDELKLHEVLQNLVTNAIHHAREAGEVVVRAQRLSRPDGEAARVIVQDDGPGLAPDQLRLVFDRYRHGNKGGTGLGLAICKEFVELHGGEIWAEIPPQGGCAFVFTLPLAKDVERGLGGPLAAPFVAQEQRRVLVVEDEPEIAAILVEVLRTRYRVDLARDGAEGLAKARTQHPDLIVMDVFLPKVDGLDAVVSLKSSTDTAGIPIILLSAHQGVAEKVRALNLGAVDYLSKPFQSQELLNRTERALTLYQTERDLERSASLLRHGGNDPETGAYDRAGFVLRMTQERARCKRYQRDLGLAVIRPDKTLGDTLRSITEYLRESLRTPDVLGHLGQGTFALLLPEVSESAARTALLRLLPGLQDFANSTFRFAIADANKEDQVLEKVLEQLGAP